MYVYLCVYPYACRMLQQNIQAPPLSDGASTIARLGQAIGLLGDPAALQARIDAYRSARRNSTTTNSHTTHTVHNRLTDFKLGRLVLNTPTFRPSSAGIN